MAGKVKNTVTVAKGEKTIKIQEVDTKKTGSIISQSNLISRDLSWLQFNYRVLDQAMKVERNIFERLKFLTITASNLDEFFMIRVGSLYNYIDYGRERVDYSGLREMPFKQLLYEESRRFFDDLNNCYKDSLLPEFENNGFCICKINSLTSEERDRVKHYFKKTIFPMLTPMVYDTYHSFPILMNQILIFGVVTRSHETIGDRKKLSFIQIPKNLPRFFEIEREDMIMFVPIEEIIRENINKLFRNIEILSVDLFRITRNGDFTLEESDDIEANFLEELRKKLKTRRTGRVVRIEITPDYNSWMIKILKSRWEIGDDNIFVVPPDHLMDYEGLGQIISHSYFKNRLPKPHPPVPPLSYPEQGTEDIFEMLKTRDILLHHPYNSIDPVIELLEKAADDPSTLSIKLTIYRLAKDSLITAALHRAAENGKHVSVLFEVKARFDEENNLKEAKKLQQAGCFVIYGIGNYKTHTKLLLIVRKEEDRVTRYVHMSSGNYNEQTSRLYTDLGILTTNEVYAHDVSEFFNVITGHSEPRIFKRLITAPRDMRNQLVDLINNEAENAKKGNPSGIVIKINSLQDKRTIEAFYEASQVGVPIRLIVRGICCLRPGRNDLSENITVRSIVGDFLEHSRVFYFHNNGSPRIYSGSADVMVRSFDRRIESLFEVTDDLLKKQLINLLAYNQKDNVNAYEMHEDGTYTPLTPGDQEPFNIHKEFFYVTRDIVDKANALSVPVLNTALPD
jgi:polyphosphate kinase